MTPRGKLKTKVAQLALGSILWAFRLFNEGTKEWVKEVLKRMVGVSSMRSSIETLREKGVVVRSVVDVGANVGQWSQLLAKLFPDAKILMIEPQPGHRQVLEQLCAKLTPRVRYAPVLVGASNEVSVPFTVLDDGAHGAGSSVMPENTNVPRHVLHLPMTTLDNLLTKLCFPSPELLKLDVQGYELEVLKGATSVLEHAQFVLLEVAIVQYNIGAPLFLDVISWMARSGFITFDIVDMHRSNNLLVQVDILFIRKESRLRTPNKLIDARWTPDADIEVLP